MYVLLSMDFYCIMNKISWACKGGRKMNQKQWQRPQITIITQSDLKTHIESSACSSHVVGRGIIVKW